MAREPREYIHRTRIGLFRIAYGYQDGMWTAWFEDELLGSYPASSTALSALIAGQTAWPSNGVDASSLSLPDTLDEWQTT